MRSVPHRVVCLLGLDDGAFPRKAPRDGDDLLLEEPHVGERDARSRGSPAAARRAAGRDRPADRHLHRQRRAHQRAPPARRAGRRAARRDRPGRPPRGSSSAIRCSRSTPATSPPTKPWSFDPTTLAGAPRPRRPAPGARAVPGRAAAAAAARRGRARRPRALRRAPRARVPAPAPRHQRGRLHDEVEDALHVELDGLSEWGVGERLLQRPPGRRRAPDRDPGRDRPRRRCRRARSAAP